VLWELGWVEESMVLLSPVPSFGMVADCHNPDEVMERRDNRVTHWFLSQFLSSHRTGGESASKGERS